LIFQGFGQQRPPPAEFEVLALDVGQGSAVLVRTAGHSLLFDTGPRYGPGADAGQSIEVPVLRAMGEQPDTVLVSHRDSDHAGGSGAVRCGLPGPMRAGCLRLTPSWLQGVSGWASLALGWGGF